MIHDPITDFENEWYHYQLEAYEHERDMKTINGAGVARPGSTADLKGGNPLEENSPRARIFKEEGIV